MFEKYDLPNRQKLVVASFSIPAHQKTIFELAFVLT